MSEGDGPKPTGDATPPVPMNYHAGPADDVDVTDPRDGVVRSVIFAIAAVVLVVALLLAVGKSAKDYFFPPPGDGKPATRRAATITVSSTALVTIAAWNTRHRK